MNLKTALVYPYFLTKAPDHILFHPLGIASLSSQLKECGADSRQFDCTFEDFDAVTGRIVSLDPAIVGIYIMATMSGNAMRMLNALKKKLPNTLFVAGGPLATLYPTRFAASFDAVFRGEADVVFPRFCLDYMRGYNRENFAAQMDFSKYHGIFTSSGGLVRQTPEAHQAAQAINSFPLPDREGIRHDLYQKIWMENTGAKPASIMTSRGCPFHCDFCSKPVFGDKFRRRRMDSVIEEVLELKKLGYDRLWIGDDCFTLDPGFVKEFCSAMIGAGTGMTWSCLSRVDTFDTEMVLLMKEAGCVKAYFGLESGSDETLKLMNKRSTVEQGAAAVRLFNSAGIGTAGFFMVGYPGESEESVESTFSMALSLPLDEISFNVPYPLPGSPLYSRLTGVKTDEDWEIENEVKFLFKSDFDQEELKKRIERTMTAFREKKVKAIKN